MKKTKRIISMILAVIMLSMTAIGINAEELIIGVDDLLEAVGIIEHDHEEEELMAMAAEDCDNITKPCNPCSYEPKVISEFFGICIRGGCDSTRLIQEQEVCKNCGNVNPYAPVKVKCKKCSQDQSIDPA